MSVPDNSDRIVRMRQLLEQAFTPQHLEIRDDSHRHAGHAGARDGRGHFNLDIRSASFAGMSPLARHRAVYDALGAMMRDDIHALAIRASAPDE